MTAYLIKSTLCLILMLLVYHLFLEKEKMHRFNRFFLLFSLFFSIFIPLLPTGLAGSFWAWEPSLPFSGGTAENSLSPVSAGLQNGAPGEIYSSRLFWQAGIFLYSLVALLLLARFIRSVLSILPKTSRYTHLPYGEAAIVLRKEKIIPYSFMNYIFLNEQNYRNGEIKREVFLHERTHVRQKHTLDILFVEILKILFWFNPVFRFYKKAIQLNHEFLADQSVIRATKRIPAYQSLLLRTLKSGPEIALASTLHFSVTKKRLLMMNQKPSLLRSAVKQFSAAVLLAAGTILFGAQPQAAAQDLSGKNPSVIIEISDSEVVRLNNKEIHISLLEKQLVGIKNEIGTDLVVSLKVNRNAYTGTVYDVQQAIRKNRVRMIHTSTLNEEEQDQDRISKISLDRTIAAFTHAANEYMDLPVRDSGREVLEAAYARMMEVYHTIGEKQNEYYRNIMPEAPPLPPLPPSPSERIMSPPPPPTVPSENPPPPPHRNKG